MRQITWYLLLVDAGRNPDAGLTGFDAVSTLSVAMVGTGSVFFCFFLDFLPPFLPFPFFFLLPFFPLGRLYVAVEVAWPTLKMSGVLGSVLR
jgi:hypothetical protein